jgi:hypothetical protein
MSRPSCNQNVKAGESCQAPDQHAAKAPTRPTPGLPALTGPVLAEGHSPQAGQVRVPGYLCAGRYATPRTQAWDSPYPGSAIILAHGQGWGCNPVALCT